MFCCQVPSQYEILTNTPLALWVTDDRYRHFLQRRPTPGQFRPCSHSHWVESLHFHSTYLDWSQLTLCVCRAPGKMWLGTVSVWIPALSSTVSHVSIWLQSNHSIAKGRMMSCRKCSRGLMSRAVQVEVEWLWCLPSLRSYFTVAKLWSDPAHLFYLKWQGRNGDL